MDSRIESNEQFSGLMSDGAPAPSFGMPFVQIRPDRGHHERTSASGSGLKPLDSAKLDTISAAAQIGEDPVKSPQAGNEILQLSFTGFFVVGAGGLWGWAIVHLLQFLFQVEQLVLQAAR